MSTLLTKIERAKQRFFKRSFGWTGVEIGCHIIHMAQVRKTADRWQLATVWSIEQATPYSPTNGSDTATTEETFGWLAPTILAEQGLASYRSHLECLDSLFLGRQCAATFNDGLIAYREIDLPTCAESEIPSLVQSEVTLEAECEFDDLLVDAWRLPANRPRASTSNLGTVSVPRSTAILIANDLLMAGFECRVLDAMPCAMARATDMVAVDRETTVLAIDLGYQQTSITLVQKGQPIFSRVCNNTGLLSFLLQVAKSFEISVADAQTLLFRTATQGKDCPVQEDDFSNPLQQKLNGFLQAVAHEIDRTINYSQRALRGMAPTQILLMGDGTRIPSIAESVEQYIGLPSSTWSIALAEGHFDVPHVATYAIASALSSLAWEAE